MTIYKVTKFCESGILQVLWVIILVYGEVMILTVILWCLINISLIKGPLHNSDSVPTLHITQDCYHKAYRESAKCLHILAPSLCS